MFQSLEFDSTPSEKRAVAFVLAASIGAGLLLGAGIALTGEDLSREPATTTTVTEITNTP